MPIEPTISGETIEGLSIVLAGQLSHAQIAKYLPEAGLTDTDPSLAKWKRIHNSFAHYQNTKRASNGILNFISKTLSPVRYADRNEEFEANRSDINIRLLFIGLELTNTGKFRKVIKATTIPEAQQRADTLKQKLRDREVHPDVLLFCKAELLQDNYFHAVFETTKSVADKIREKTNLKEDGSELVDLAFGLSRTPKLSFNPLVTESEISEHRGFANLVRGMFGMFRNTTAHVPKIRWKIDEQNALDCLTIASMLHRMLDKCILK
jgi:uncharacterized protein (TIGR02391 family)